MRPNYNPRIQNLKLKKFWGIKLKKSEKSGTKFNFQNFSEKIINIKSFRCQTVISKNLLHKTAILAYRYEYKLQISRSVTVILLNVKGASRINPEPQG